MDDQPKSESHESHPVISSSFGSTTPTIMIVDDDLAIVGLFANILGHAGFNVRKSFRNGKELLDYLSSSTSFHKVEPDLVLLDYNMPEMNGLDTAKILRGRYPTMRIVMITAYKLKATSSEYFDAFMVKPISINQLVNTVSRILR